MRRGQQQNTELYIQSRICAWIYALGKKIKKTWQIGKMLMLEMGKKISHSANQ
jgi:hypothetical protein